MKKIITLAENIHPVAHAILSTEQTELTCHAGAVGEDPETQALLKKTHLLGIRSRTQLNKEQLKKAEQLLAIGCFCIGTNQVDLKEAALLGIPVFNAPHANTRSVAELVLGLTIMLYRGIFSKNAAAHQGQWQKSAEGCHEIRGKTLGIIGYGHIGSQLSVIAEALGMRVLYYDIIPKLPLGNASATPSLETLLQQADVISCHVPETQETHHLMNASHLEKMKPGSYLINASRGHVVDLHALKNALDRNHIAGAALDVFPEEPKTATESFNNILCQHPKVILTPHIGGSTEEAQYQIATDVSGKLIRYLNTGNTQGAVNFPQTQLPSHENSVRFIHIHRNQPGMLGEINRVIAEEHCNVVGQSLETQHEIGVALLDIQAPAPKALAQHLSKINGTIHCRMIDSNKETML